MRLYLNQFPHPLFSFYFTYLLLDLFLLDVVQILLYFCKS